MRICILAEFRPCAYDFYDVYYYKPDARAKEIDFAVCDKNKAIELIQVAYEIESPRAYDRETSSLVKASGALSCNNLTLIAFSTTRDVEIFETDAVDWKLAELIVNIQYACQRHYFLALAEKYFDDQMREISVNAHRNSKTIENFNRLPDEFTVEDVMQCFAIGKENIARVKISRLIKDNFVEKIGEYPDNGSSKAVYQKTGLIMR